MERTIPRASVMANPRTLPLASAYRTAAAIRVVTFPVQDGRSCLLEPSRIARMNRLSGTDLLLDTGINDNVRIDRHTDR